MEDDWEALKREARQLEAALEVMLNGYGRAGDGKVQPGHSDEEAGVNSEVAQGKKIEIALERVRRVVGAIARRAWRQAGDCGLFKRARGLPQPDPLICLPCVPTAYLLAVSCSDRALGKAAARAPYTC